VEGKAVVPGIPELELVQAGEARSEATREGDGVVVQTESPEPRPVGVMGPVLHLGSGLPRVFDDLELFE
jgi:hypothetical protein